VTQPLHAPFGKVRALAQRERSWHKQGMRVVWGCGGLVVLVLTLGCKRSAVPACPSAATLEAIHAATFWLERKEPNVAAELGQALLAQDHGMDAPTRARVRTLVAAASEAATQPDRVHLVGEETRMWLRDWACLSEENHVDFHTRLPAVNP
jgi:hypothetical protein